MVYVFHTNFQRIAKLLLIVKISLYLKRMAPVKLITALVPLLPPKTKTCDITK